MLAKSSLVVSPTHFLSVVIITAKSCSHKVFVHANNPIFHKSFIDLIDVCCFKLKFKQVSVN